VLHHCIRTRNVAPPSYDIDGDGCVTQQDLKLARNLDKNYSGKIDTSRRQEAKICVAEELYKHYETPAHLATVDSSRYHDIRDMKAGRSQFCHQVADLSDRQFVSKVRTEGKKQGTKRGRGAS